MSPARRALLGGAALALAAQYVPSVVALGEWSSIRVLPGGYCRWRGPDRPGVALTFDDGPDPASTPAVLDALGEAGLRATFFCTGAHVDRHGALVADIVGGGHQVETHGYRHAHHLARSPRWIVRDLERAVASLAVVHRRPRWYRPSYGQATGATLLAARALGLSTVLWSTAGREWTTSSHEVVARRVRRGLAPGAIVLLHDSDATGTPGMADVARRALARIAVDLGEMGLAALTLDELVEGEASQRLSG